MSLLAFALVVAHAPVLAQQTPEDGAPPVPEITGTG